jgi:hypothetical protein
MRLAAVDSVTGISRIWNAAIVGNSVRCLEVIDTVVYFGGSFTQIAANIPRANIAAVRRSDGGVIVWYPDANGVVYAMAASGDTIAIGGTFTTAGGETRHNIAAVLRTSNSALAWAPSLGGTVRALKGTGPAIIAGGDFNILGGQRRNSLAAFDASTGVATSWAPALLGNYVYAMALNSHSLYVAGAFTKVGSENRTNLASFTRSTGELRYWTSTPNNIVRALAANDSTVYIGGDFTTMSSVSRNRLARVGALTGALDASWNPGAGNQVRALLLHGNTLYVGGAFTSCGGASRNRIASIDSATAKATSWNPGMDGDVLSLAARDTVIYAGGMFYFAGGVDRRGIAALDSATGRPTITAFNPGLNPGVTTALTVSGDVVYAGKSFIEFPSTDQQRRHLEAFDAATGAATSWHPEVEYSVNAIVTTPTKVYIGWSTPWTSTTATRPSIGQKGLGLAVFADPANPALPVQMLSFQASAVGMTSVRLQWRTATETNNAGWEVERRSIESTVGSMKTDADRWAKVGWIDGAGASTSHREYVFSDQIPDTRSPITSPSARSTSLATSSLGTRLAYRLRQVDRSGSFTYSHEVEVEIDVGPKMFHLAQNYPNPFNPTTELMFTLATTGPMRLAVYDLLGREVSVVAEGLAEAGRLYRITFDASRLPSGVYVARLSSGGQSSIRRMLLCR